MKTKTIEPKTPPPPTAITQRTPWQSPVPYLFGGLAAMLGLIAFALLILACSYWKLSAQENDIGEIEGRDLESGNEKDEEKEVKFYEEKVLVIMAGDQKPTFLATPVFVQVSNSFESSNVSGNFDNKELAENCLKAKEMGIHDPDKEVEEEAAS